MHNKNCLAMAMLLFLPTICFSSPILNDIPSEKNTWQHVQKLAENTTIQVFSAIAKFDWIEPYRTPLQEAGRGSGFFINDQGYFITNFHVIENAVEVMISLPGLTKTRYEARVVGKCPRNDIALCCLTDEALMLYREQCGDICYLSFGDSNTVCRADSVLLLGYPLGEEILKTTMGVVSGFSNNAYASKSSIQIDAACNPGSSGGPLLDSQGLVIGIENSYIRNAQNTTFVIPINILKGILNDLYMYPLLEMPDLNIITQSHNNNELCDYYGNPKPGGLLINKVIADGLCDRAGIKAGDMIYEFNGYPVDRYGEILLPWNEEKIGFGVYMSQLPLNSQVSLFIYRNGNPLTFVFNLELLEDKSIKKEYPEHTFIDYEVFAGMVIMPLTANHIAIMGNQLPALKRYLTPEYNNEQRLVITNIFPNCELARNRTIFPGDTINKVNGKTIRSIDDLRKALLKSIDTQQVVITTMNEATLINDVLTILPFKKCCLETKYLSHMYRYPISSAVSKILKQAAL